MGRFICIVFNISVRTHTSLKIQEIINFNVNDWKGMLKIQSSMPKGNICKSQMIRQIVLKQCLIKIMPQRSVTLSDILIRQIEVHVVKTTQ